ncbi:EscC/YscC/HrcC family type III secretion system outer membrane ring protein [Pandoraea anapnoica]|uniref:EscC/YscC/HrcC family type III secretion system outer membrane ring protein n=1 Tax=Pandoraea anapnoica TaxID=2508301 RepID=A0A5E5ABD5_9BURK|nr:type III secretion system outer membrane ring subunit SctC [Pandoraea anapnoica]VVE69845.1 EscC/YscC/HrcC family type III secretion system outer membrane ring protein [Pandoraea anapnoica]
MKKMHYVVCAMLAAGASNVAVASWAMALSSAGALEGASPASAPRAVIEPQAQALPQALEPVHERASRPEQAVQDVQAVAPVPTQARQGLGASGGYVARNDNLRVFFAALSPYLGRPLIVSNLAAKKQISGDFDMSNARALLESMANRLGLIWYHDGQSIFIYDASEIRNATVSMTHTNLSDLVSYLRGAGLYDRRYPIRGEASRKVFYVSGPPVYVDLVLAASRSIDRTTVNDVPAAGPDRIGVVRMENGFVSDRTYQMRDEKIVIPGMESVIKELVETARGGAGSLGGLLPPSTQLPLSPQDARGVPAPLLPPGPKADTALPPAALNAAPPLVPPTRPGSIGEGGRGQLIVQAYPAGNSLLVRGTAEQVERIERLVSRLDAPRRHIELSLWIIDVRKEALDSLGVDWSGGVSIGSHVGVLLNTTAPVSTLDGVRFLAKIQAIASRGLATVVSRPVILTQENIPAMFDGSQTFYVPLEGERTTDLRSVTYGTMISVWPRFAGLDEIEMTLNIEDGTSAPSKPSDAESKYTVLPTVSRTRISTIARVPQGKSLLIGGYTRDGGDTVEKKIPLLGDIPWIGRAFRYTSTAQNNEVRVFLIQPREIDGPLQRDASDIAGDTVATLPYPVDGVSKGVRATTGLDPARADPAAHAAEAREASGASPYQSPSDASAEQHLRDESVIPNTGADRGQS